MAAGGLFRHRVFAQWLQLAAADVATLMVVQSLQEGENPASQEAILAEVNRVLPGQREEDVRSSLLTLVRRGLLTQPAEGEYVLDLAAVQTALTAKKRELLDEVTDLESTASSLESAFSTTSGPAGTHVTYLPQEKLFSTMTKLVSTADKCYFTTNFPNIAYTRRLAYLPEMKRYIEVLQKRCFTDKVPITYLLRLQPEKLYNTALRVFSDPDKAYLETLEMLSILEDQIQRYPHLDIRYLTQPFGIDSIIFMRKEPEDAIFFIRDPEMEPIGAVYLMHPPVVARIEYLYHEFLKSTPRLQGAVAAETFATLKERFEKSFEEIRNQ